MRKINFFVPIIGLAVITIALQAPTIKDYMSDSGQLDKQLSKCISDIADPHNDQRCINASMAATHNWQIEMNAAVTELNKKNAVVKALIDQCATPSCFTETANTPQSKELEAAKQAWQKLQDAKPPVWATS